ncbi:hypothetical protein NLI96_g12717 [Meripilus lineatus]|uniref:Uncharacterized protein n=1 Tax=Meripilus lineatus TaxID=2056292 RepID=A0AAD5UU23_9APHY|nr:hypothetical protein NLI96_g12717 [Physisporinus lineatus]
MARSEGSYYREHVSYSPIASTSHHHIDELTYDQDVHQDIHHDSLQDTNHDQGHHLISPIKHCSVRGCTAVLPPEYPLKMCEQCRSRHRIYATTKRAKRKMEKAALGGQTCHSGQVVWMPLDAEDQYHPQHIPSSSHRHDMSVSPEPQMIMTPHDQPYPYSPSWSSSNVDNVDPRLYAANLSSSELAGALTLPPTPPPRDPPEMQLLSEHYAMDLNESYNQSPSSSRSPASVPTTGEISTKSIEEAAAQLGDPSLPHRYCSIKGCKAVIPGNSFFKMCEPCRNRYRSYGTTKRAKWRKEKEVVVAELQKLREDEDKRRAENGLPPLPEGDEEWKEHLQQLSPLRLSRSSFAQVAPSFAPRMCTVSHCREILPGDYEFLRCERHRIQNRHHSKLKRVRDKESKLEACTGWAAVVHKNSPNKDTSASDSEDDYEEDPDMYAKVGTSESWHAMDTHIASHLLQALPEGEPGTGVPPAARGSRRTNHVCSIKVCYNLLSPNNPWKMCDSCRARDRSARRNKALRDSGVPVDPLPPRARSPAKSDGDKKGKKKSKKKTVDVNDEGDATSNDNIEEGSSAEGATLVFMSPLVMEPAELHADSPHLSNGSADLSFIHADETGNITEPLDVQLMPVPTLIPVSQQMSTLHANSLTPNSGLSKPLSRGPVNLD